MATRHDDEPMGGFDEVENVLEAIAAVTACVAGATLLIRWIRKQPTRAEDRRAWEASEARQRARAR